MAASSDIPATRSASSGVPLLAGVELVPFKAVQAATGHFASRSGSDATGDLYCGRLRGEAVIVQLLRLTIVPSACMPEQLSRRFDAAVRKLAACRYTACGLALRGAAFGGSRAASRRPVSLIFSAAGDIERLVRAAAWPAAMLTGMRHVPRVPAPALCGEVKPLAPSMHATVMKLPRQQRRLRGVDAPIVPNNAGAMPTRRKAAPPGTAGAPRTSADLQDGFAPGAAASVSDDKMAGPYATSAAATSPEGAAIASSTGSQVDHEPRAAATVCCSSCSAPVLEAHTATVVESIGAGAGAMITARALCFSCLRTTGAEPAAELTLLSQQQCLPTDPSAATEVSSAEPPAGLAVEATVEHGLPDDKSADGLNALEQLGARLLGAGAEPAVMAWLEQLEVLATSSLESTDAGGEAALRLLRHLRAGLQLRPIIAEASTCPPLAMQFRDLGLPLLHAAAAAGQSSCATEALIVLSRVAEIDESVVTDCADELASHVALVCGYASADTQSIATGAHLLLRLTKTRTQAAGLHAQAPVPPVVPLPSFWAAQAQVLTSLSTRIEHVNHLEAASLYSVGSELAVVSLATLPFAAVNDAAALPVLKAALQLAHRKLVQRPTYCALGRFFVDELAIALTRTLVQAADSLDASTLTDLGALGDIPPLLLLAMAESAEKKGLTAALAAIARYVQPSASSPAAGDDARGMCKSPSSMPLASAVRFAEVPPGHDHTLQYLRELAAILLTALSQLATQVSPLVAAVPRVATLQEIQLARSAAASVTWLLCGPTETLRHGSGHPSLVPYAGFLASRVLLGHALTKCAAVFRVFSGILTIRLPVDDIRVHAAHAAMEVVDNLFSLRYDPARWLQNAHAETGVDAGAASTGFLSRCRNLTGNAFCDMVSGGTSDIADALVNLLRCRFHREPASPAVSAAMCIPRSLPVAAALGQVRRYMAHALWVAVETGLQTFASLDQAEFSALAPHVEDTLPMLFEGVDPDVLLQLLNTEARFGPCWPLKAASIASALQRVVSAASSHSPASTAAARSLQRGGLSKTLQAGLTRSQPWSLADLTEVARVITVGAAAKAPPETEIMIIAASVSAFIRSSRACASAAPAVDAGKAVSPTDLQPCGRRDNGTGSQATVFAFDITADSPILSLCEWLLRMPMPLACVEQVWLSMLAIACDIDAADDVVEAAAGIAARHVARAAAVSRDAQLWISVDEPIRHSADGAPVTASSDAAVAGSALGGAGSAALTTSTALATAEVVSWRRCAVNSEAVRQRVDVDSVRAHVSDCRGSCASASSVRATGRWCWCYCCSCRSPSSAGKSR